MPGPDDELATSSKSAPSAPSLSPNSVLLEARVAVAFPRGSLLALGAHLRCTDGTHRLRLRDPVYTDQGLEPGDRIVGIATDEALFATPRNALAVSWRPLDVHTSVTVRDMVGEAIGALVEVRPQSERDLFCQEWSDPAEASPEVRAAQAALGSGAFSSTAISEEGLRMLGVEASRALRTSARTRVRTSKAIPGDRAALSARRTAAEGQASSMEAAATSLATLGRRRPEPRGPPAKRHTTATGDSRLRSDFAAIARRRANQPTEPGRTVPMARRAARSRARAKAQAAQRAALPYIERRLGEDEVPPRPKIHLVVQGLRPGSLLDDTDQATPCQAVADLSAYEPLPVAPSHDGTHPRAMEAAVEAPSFAEALRAVQVALDEAMGVYVGCNDPGPSPAADDLDPPVLHVGIQSEAGRLSAALARCASALLGAEGFGAYVEWDAPGCTCALCSRADAFDHLPDETRARAVRVWNARPRLWPPRIRIAKSELPEQPEETLEARYAAQGYEELPPARPKKERPNPQGMGARMRRRLLERKRRRRGEAGSGTRYR